MNYVIALDEGALLGLGLVALAVVLVAIFAGYQIRGGRDEKEIREAEKNAANAEIGYNNERSARISIEKKYNLVLEIDSLLKEMALSLKESGITPVDFDRDSGVITFAQAINGRIIDLPFKVSLGKRIMPIQILKNDEIVGEPLDDIAEENIAKIVKILVGMSKSSDQNKGSA